MSGLPNIKLIREGIDMGFIVGNATVITVDKQRRVINDGAVAVNDALIEAVGKTD